MNGPVSMYKLKPVVHFQDTILDLTPSLYKMKNICSSNFRSTEVEVKEDDVTRRFPNVLEQVNKLLKKPILEVEVLRKRQEGILTQLTYLKDQILALRNELGKKNSEPSSSIQASSVNEVDGTHHEAVKTELQWDGAMQDIVVLASPEWPPYSLLVVNQLWPGVLRLHISCHTHSSISYLPPHLVAFSSLGCIPKPNLNMRLIWKQMGSDCEIICSPVSHSPIRGEVNLLRYLHRTINPTNDLISELKQDNILDLCHRLSHVRTVHDKKLLVRMLNARLGKSSWLGGDSMTIADVAAWSTLCSLSGIELSQNMSKWKTRCSAMAGVKAA